MTTDEKAREKSLSVRAARHGLDLVQVPYGGKLKKGYGYSLHKRPGNDERRVAVGRNGMLDDIERYLNENPPRSSGVGG
jgi:hypothetical protein